MEDHTVSWYEAAVLDDGPNRRGCTNSTRCPDAEPNGNCDSCGTVDGRDMEVVNEYASTCDGPCADLTSHGELTMDPYTQLGYCVACIPTLPKDIRERVEAVLDGTWEGPLY